MTTSNATGPVVVAMLKAPRVGHVKTRLGAQIGLERATRIYRLLAERQTASVPRDWRTEIHFSPSNARAEMQGWLGDGPAYFPQCEGDLGQRLTDAVAGAFGRGASAVIVVGGDCPDLDETCLRRAHEALQTVDVVLGPAWDGGYTLIGLRRPELRLFEDIPWSTDQVLTATLERAAAGRLRHVFLVPKEDIDDLAGLRRFIDNPAESDPTLRDQLVAVLA